VLEGAAIVGCSVLLHDNAAQCFNDRDCERLGFQHWTCDPAGKVCISGAGAAESSDGSVTGRASDAGGGAMGGSTAGLPGGSAGSTGNSSGGAGSAGSSSGGSAGSSSGGSAGSSSGGSAGSSSGGSAGSVDGGMMVIPDWPALAPVSSGVRVRIRSFCTQPLWVRATSQQSGTLMPDDSALKAGGIVSLSAPAEWLSGEILVYGSGPRAVLLHEMSVSVSRGITYFGLQYLNLFGLPVEVAAYGGSCSASAHTRSCSAHESDVATCPETFLKDGSRCLSPSSYCSIPANQPAAYCHALDTAIGSCRGCPAGSTLDVYAGTGAYGPEARLAAALNRGMTSQPDNSNAFLYYQQTPYNTYAKWVHGLCPAAIAFSHDDFGTTVPLYPSCDASELRITLCPAR